MAPCRQLAPVVLLVLAGCSREAPSREPEPTVVAPEQITTARRELIETGPRLSGTLQPERRAAIRAKVGGSIIHVQAEVGQTVRAGQLLARIDAPALRDAYNSTRSGVSAAQTELAMARRQLQRVEQLVSAGALPQRELDNARSAVAAAQSRVAAARAQVAQAREQLEAATIVSPIRGVVGERAVSEGDVVAPGALLFTVIDPSSMRLEASVPSEQLEALRLGAPVDFEVRGYPRQTFTGRITRMAPAADPVTRQVQILVSIPNPGGKLLAGLFVEGRVAAERRETLVVPAAALLQEEGATVVTRIRNGVTERVPVEIGLRDERADRVEITGGLQQGDQVLVGPARAIKPGTLVRVTQAAAPQRG